MATSFFIRYPASSWLSQAATQAAVTAALQAVLPTDLVAQDIHDASAATINGSGGAFVAFGAGITIPAGAKGIQISSNLGEPVQVSLAANSGAASASAQKVYLVPGGSPGAIIPFILGAGNKLFIRSLSANTITSSYITANIVG